MVSETIFSGRGIEALSQWAAAVDSRIVQASNQRVRLLLSALPLRNVHIELASPLLVPAPKWPWQKEQLSHVNHVQVGFDAPAEALTALSRSA